MAIVRGSGTLICFSCDFRQAPSKPDVWEWRKVPSHEAEAHSGEVAVGHRPQLMHQRPPTQRCGWLPISSSTWHSIALGACLARFACSVGQDALHTALISADSQQSQSETEHTAKPEGTVAL